MTAPLMIGVSGLRGIAGESLTRDVAARFAGAFAGWLREERGVPEPMVVVSRDGRIGGDVFHAAAIRSLIAAGVDVIDIGIATTPTTAVAVDAARADGAMIVTASHNPQEWNGLKCLVRGNAAASADSAPPQAGSSDALASDLHFLAHAPAPHDARAIIDRFNHGVIPPPARQGSMRPESEAMDIHVSRVCAAICDLPPPQPGQSVADLAAGLTIALDSVEASGGPAGRSLLEVLGCDEILHLGGGCSGTFPHTPEPTLENLTSLREAVRGAGAHIGFAQDPDADRLAIVDETGRYIGEEYTLVLAAMALLEAGVASSGATLCANLSTSRMIDDVAASHGARVVRTPVGEAHVAQAIVHNHAMIGGEGNGGVIWAQVTLVRDSLSAMALVLWLLARRRQPLSRIVAEIPRYVIVKHKIDLPRREDASAAIESIAARFSSHAATVSGPASVMFDLQDGLRIDLPAKRAWLHVRPSNTEPIMRLIAEAPSDDEASALLETARATVMRV